IGKIDSRVHRTDGLIIPLGNFAEEDFRQSIGSKFNFRVDSGDVVGRNDCSEHGGNIQDLEFRILQLFVSHWHVARAEIDGACGDLTDSAAATDGLVVDLNSWMRLAILTEPLGIHRIWEGGACSVECGLGQKWKGQKYAH